LAAGTCLAFVLVILAFILQALARHPVNQQVDQLTYSAYRLLLHGVLLMLVIFLKEASRFGKGLRSPARWP
jgi:hypothetical protein